MRPVAIALALFAGTPLLAQNPTPPPPEKRAATAAEIQQAALKSDTSVTSAAATLQGRRFNHKKKIKSEFDRFRNRTVVTAEVTKRGLFGLGRVSGPEVELFFSYPGRELQRQPSYVF